MRNHIPTGAVAGPSVNVDAGTNFFACWVPTFLTVGRSSDGKALVSCPALQGDRTFNGNLRDGGDEERATHQLTVRVLYPGAFKVTMAPYRIIHLFPAFIHKDWLVMVTSVPTSGSDLMVLKPFRPGFAKGPRDEGGPWDHQSCQGRLELVRPRDL